MKALEIQGNCIKILQKVAIGYHVYSRFKLSVETCKNQFSFNEHDRINKSVLLWLGFICLSITIYP